MKVATCSAPTNIAVIKYWGKDNVGLNTPMNSSMSITLHQDQLRTTTSVAGGSRLQRTRLECTINKRRRHLHIVSTNSFPTAAGLASSAAGFACLVATLAKFYGISKADEEYPGQLSAIARQGSGSACRSLDGGFVAWQKGERPDGRDSIAVQVANEIHWPGLCAVVCVVDDTHKDTSSTIGMQTTKATSPLLTYRAKHLVAGRMKTMEKAILERDFETLRHTHNAGQQPVIRLVHRYNEQAGCVQAAYTFDAGPNAVVFVEEQHVQQLVSLVHHCFSTPSMMTIRSSIPINRTPSDALLEQMQTNVESGTTFKLPHVPNSIKLMYISRVGGGTRVLLMDEALVDASSLWLPSEQTLRYLATAAAAAAVAGNLAKSKTK
ncbi:unnamed protein product [Peronospora destructor]|uniref:Diphosphomevalonate decarboxylase n=1 Tax=Peronospora destructor TaxID=86335 RepID=A0AAV0TB37_9STRA|nr:unnamed protein product [Peronospora destructor]